MPAGSSIITSRTSAIISRTSAMGHIERFENGGKAAFTHSTPQPGLSCAAPAQHEPRPSIMRPAIRCSNLICFSLPPNIQSGAADSSLSRLNMQRKEFSNSNFASPSFATPSCWERLKSHRRCAASRDRCQEARRAAPGLSRSPAWPSPRAQIRSALARPAGFRREAGKNYTAAPARSVCAGNTFQSCGCGCLFPIGGTLKVLLWSASPVVEPPSIRFAESVRTLQFSKATTRVSGSPKTRCAVLIALSCVSATLGTTPPSRSDFEEDPLAFRQLWSRPKVKPRTVTVSRLIS
jgi:hypothetical protein